MNKIANKYHQGFTLIEVMIALTVFATFIVAYIASEGYNVTDSLNMKKELVLQKLCEYKINEIMLNPPEFTKSLTLSSKTGNFDEIGYPEYQYEVKYNIFKIPDLTKLSGASEDGERDSDRGTSNLEKVIFENMQKNIEEMIWQVKVTVKQKGEDFNFTLSAWLKNEKAKININI